MSPLLVPDRLAEVTPIDRLTAGGAEHEVILFPLWGSSVAGACYRRSKV
jgi:hypothetical protein